MKRLFFLLAALCNLGSPAYADALVAAGSASNAQQCVSIGVRDTSVTTKWQGLTGLVFNTGSLVCYYHRNTASSAVSMSLATMTLGTWATNGFKEVDSANAPGIYQVCLPNLAVATGADSVTLKCKGAANMEETQLRVNLTGPNTTGWDGQLAGKSGTTLTLWAGAVPADNAFAYEDEVVFVSSTGSVKANSCIASSTAASANVVTLEDISALLTVGDNGYIRPNAACRALRGTPAGTLLTVTGGSAATSSVGASAVASGAQNILSAYNFTSVITGSGLPANPGIKLDERFVPTMAWISTTWVAGSTLDIILQHSPDGTTWYDAQTFTQVTTAAGNEVKILSVPLFRYVRAKATTTTGGSVNYTTTLQLWGYLNK